MWTRGYKRLEKVEKGRKRSKKVEKDRKRSKKIEKAWGLQDRKMIKVRLNLVRFRLVMLV